MRLVVDASTLVAEALRAKGRALLVDPNLDLLATPDVWQETQHELRKGIALLLTRGSLSESAAEELSAASSVALRDQLTVVPAEVFGVQLSEAAWRILRDHSDAPTVALALALDCGIWINDRDFFGCGLPVWTTDVLRSYLERHAGDQE